MRILMCSPDEGDGGITRWTGYIANHFGSIGEPGLDFELMPMNAAAYVGENAGALKRLRVGIKSYGSFIKRFKQRLKDSHPDVVHICTSASLGLFRDYLLVNACKKRGVKTSVHFHFGRIPALAEIKNWEWRMLLKISKLADKVVVMDSLSLNTLREAGIEKAIFVPNPITNEVLVAAERTGEKIDFSKAYFVGHLLKTKGLEELLDTTEKINDLEIRLIGSDPQGLKEVLKEKAKSKGVDNRFVFMGSMPHDEVIRTIKQGIFVFPSHTEGFPNVILEAMACGVPIVATRIGAIAEMLAVDSDEPCGLCIKPKNVDELVDAINKLRCDKKLALRMAENAAKRVRAQYGIETVGRQLIDCWKK